MRSTAQVTIDTTTPPILIIDKEGFWGHLLAEKLRKFTNVVFVSGKEVSAGKKLLSLPFGRVLSHIPDETYSHIFFIPQNSEDITDHIDTLVKKTNKDKAVCVVILEKFRTNLSTLETLKSYSGDLLIVIMGDVFGKFVPRGLSEFILHLKTKKNIKLSNMGLNNYFPILLDDAFTEIIKLSFGSSKKRFYLVYPSFPVTQLGIVRSLRQIDPEITIDFLHEAGARNLLSVTIEGTRVLPEEYDALGKIQKVYKEIGNLQLKKGTPLRTSSQAGEALPTVTEKFTGIASSFTAPRNDVVKEEQFWNETTYKRKGTHAWFLAVSIFLITFLLCFIIIPLVLLFRGAQLVLDARKSIEQGNISNAFSKIQTSKNLFKLSSEIVALTGASNAAVWIDGKNKILEVFSSLISGIKTLQQGNDPYLGIALLQKGFLEIGQVSYQDPFVNTFKNLSPFVIDNTSAIADIFGFSGPRTYLILFQNNMELRPGGGFIGSYALAKVNKGKIDSLNISDVYDADGQLKAHVEPPFPVRRYLGKVHSYLRDSNFDVDFPKDGFSSAFLLQLETGEKADGVLGVDLSFAKELIGAVKGVYVPEYNANVTSDNFFSLAEKNAENDFFPGSSQKKDFLHSVFNALQQKLKSHGLHDSQGVIAAIIAGIKNKHILFVSGNPSLEDLLTAQGISGSIWDGRIASGNTILDSAGINEANIGVNKANAFVTRSVSQNIRISPTGSISGILSVRIKNASTGAWPGGEYVAYLQVILPINSRIQNIAIDGVIQKITPAITDFLVYEKTGFTAPEGLEVNTSIENNKNISGFVIRVPIMSEKKIDIYYSLGASINLADPMLSYDLLYQKQPGTDEYPYEATITVPDDYTYYKGDGFAGSSSQAIFLGNISTDKRLTMTFRKK